MAFAQRRNGAPRWHFVYLALAGFNLVTILLSISITQNLMGMYSDTVKRDGEWTSRVAGIQSLAELSQNVFSPVSQSLVSGDIATETANRNRRLGLFEVKLQNLRKDVSASVEAADRAGLDLALSQVDGAMKDLVRASDEVFSALSARKLAVVAHGVAAMTEAQGRLVKAVAEAAGLAREIQTAVPREQIALARSMQGVEFALAGMVLLMVLGAAAYGHKLGKVMRNQNQENERNRAAAEAANQAKSNFLASMSHEIRTPMNGILGMAQALDSSELATPARDKVGVILDSGRSLLAVLNDVLDFSKIEAGKFDITPSPNDIIQMASSVVRLFETHARDRNLTLTLNHDKDLPNNLVCDAERVRQCLSNLISNALKFTPSGGIDVHLAWRKDADDNAVVFVSVADTGIGMSAEVMGRLFKPFTQADNSIARRYGGTGLGLAISMRLAHLMGGTMFVESAPDLGSRFVFTFQAKVLPVAAVAAPAQAAAGQPGRPQLAGLRGARILLTDDNSVNRQVVKLFLAPHGCKITEAVNGQEALDRLAEAEFDLVLLDVHMPVMDGKEAIKHVRASDAPWRDIPVIALTADAMTGDREHLISLGMSDYLSKPVDQHALAAKMRSLLNIASSEVAAVA
jgi:signal transduction histidine kinase/ActR/RegA family two-component response regulator